MPADHDQKHGRALGHYTGSSGNMRSYETKSLPERPVAGSAIHDVTCTCGLHLRVEVMSAIKTTRRRWAKLGGALVFAVATIWVVTRLNAVQEDPITFQYPAWLPWLVVLLIVLGLGAVSLFAFGIHEHGVRIVSREGRGQRAHKIVRDSSHR